jgi:dihydroneopterin aldolase
LDKIILPHMEFFGYHGVFVQEKAVGQTFAVAVEMSLDLSKAGISDNLKDTIDYSDVYLEIKKLVEKEKFNLLEALAQAIAQMLLSRYSLSQVKVRVDKPYAPVFGGHIAARVEIVRENR